MAIKIKILLIEDDQDDVEFLTVALQEHNVTYSMETLTRGDQVVKRLETIGALPDLIIMDLNLPMLHGREVLCKIREHRDYREIPLLVLTTSSSAYDRDYCLENGATTFATKPATTEGFAELVHTIISLVKAHGERVH